MAMPSLRQFGDKTSPAVQLRWQLPVAQAESQTRRLPRALLRDFDRTKKLTLLLYAGTLVMQRHADLHVATSATQPKQHLQHLVRLQCLLSRSQFRRHRASAG